MKASLKKLDNPLLATSGRGFVIGKRGAQFEKGIPFQDWAKFGEAMIGVEDCTRFVIGDWLNFGNAEFGKKYESALDLVCQDPSDIEKRKQRYQYLADCAWVCRSVEFSRRREKSFEHHREVAPLDPELQDKYLDLAVRNKWSVSQLRIAIRTDAGEVAKLDWKPQFDPSGWAMEGIRWFKKEIEKQPIDKWSAERRALIKTKWQPLVELWNLL